MIDNVELIYKVTTPKIIFCDVENYEIAAEVSRNLNLNAPVYVMNGVKKGAANILELVKAKVGIRNEPFEWVSLLKVISLLQITVEHNFLAITYHIVIINVPCHC